MSLQTRLVPISKLTSDPQNVRTHDDKNLDAIRRSLENFGQRKPIVVARANDNSLVVIAGNGTLEAAKSLGWTEIAVAEDPKDWDADKARAYAIADNRSGELASWNDVALASALVDLDAVGWDLQDLGFTPADLDPSEQEAAERALEEQNAYTAAINVPQYEIVGERPALDELRDETRAERLRSKILRADIPEDIREFLLAAANRHVVFNYRKVAEFYPHASAEVQQLMEDSALIIIDAEDAIRNGYANFMNTINALEEHDRYGAQ